MLFSANIFIHNICICIYDLIRVGEGEKNMRD